MPRQSKPSPAGANRWYPTSSQLKDTAGVQQSFRVLLDQFYDLQGKHEELQKTVAAGSAAAAQTASAKGPSLPPGSGPSDTKLLGLNVEPVDVNSLANGATLKFNKSGGTFKFS